MQQTWFENENRKNDENVNENVNRNHANENFDENFDCKNENFDCKKMKKMFDFLYDEMIDFSDKIETKQQSDIDFANVCYWKLFEFELFKFWLIDVFWLIANRK